MIKAFKILDGHLVPLEKLEDLDPAMDNGWIDMLNPALEEDKIVEMFLGISIPTKEDMKEIELSNRLYEENGADYLTMLAINQKDLDEPSKTPVTFILYNKTLVTVRYAELMSFTQFAVRAQKKGGVTTGTPNGLMLDIVEALINRIADSLEILGDDMDTLSDNIFRPQKTKVAIKTNMLHTCMKTIGAKGDLIGMLRESLAGIMRLLSHHQAVSQETLSKPLRSKLNSLSRDVLSLNDHAAFLSGKVNFLLEATLGVINLEQNQIIKIFSIAAVVFLPPTLIASIYGMNFHNMPEVNSTYGYPIALVAMLISALVPIAYFKSKGWL